jgi:hypothetical protein
LIVGFFDSKHISVSYFVATKVETFEGKVLFFDDEIFDKGLITFLRVMLPTSNWDLFVNIEMTLLLILPMFTAKAPADRFFRNS